MASLTLQAPTLSHEAGAYSIRDYTLPLEINNPNPEGSSEVYYAVDYGSWTHYDGALSLAPDVTIQTMAVANDVSEYNNSSMVSADYSATPVSLNPPAIQTNYDAFGVFEYHDITVSITDSNITDPSSLEYRIDDGDWMAYKRFVQCEAPGTIPLDSMSRLAPLPRKGPTASITRTVRLRPIGSMRTCIP